MSGSDRGLGSRANPPNSASGAESVGTDWFKRRGYRHFDRPVGDAFAAKAMKPEFVARHSFSPLIHYEKPEKRYRFCDKAKKRVITTKNRPIKYASHRDACILGYYT